MTIRLENVGKKFNHEWLFRQIDYSFQQGRSYAITGPNGSGKSTFIQLVAGNQLLSEGSIRYLDGESEIPVEEIYREIVITAPYLELVEEFTLEEAIDFHFRFKEIKHGYTKEDLIEIGMFSASVRKYVRHFSSGMKQRLKLLLAFYSKARILLLDEPTTNLDKPGIEWYLERVGEQQDSLILVASNQSHEYSFCQDQFSLDHYKH